MRDVASGGDSHEPCSVIIARRHSDGAKTDGVASARSTVRRSSRARSDTPPITVTACSMRSRARRRTSTRVFYSARASCFVLQSGPEPETPPPPPVIATRCTPAAAYSRFFDGDLPVHLTLEFQTRRHVRDGRCRAPSRTPTRWCRDRAGAWRWRERFPSRSIVSRTPSRRPGRAIVATAKRPGAVDPTARTAREMPPMRSRVRGALGRRCSRRGGARGDARVSTTQQELRGCADETRAAYLARADLPELVREDVCRRQRGRGKINLELIERSWRSSRTRARRASILAPAGHGGIARTARASARNPRRRRASVLARSPALFVVGGRRAT